MVDIALKCRCGTVRGSAQALSPKTSPRVICLCDDCQAYAHFLGREKDVLDANGGTDITATVPANVKLLAGLDKIKAIRMTAKGPFRWYAGCCNTPMANTPPLVGVPYTGLIHCFMDHAAAGRSREQDLGPVFVRIQGKWGKGPLPEGTSLGVSAKMIFKVLRLAVPAKLKGANRPHPFFDAAGRPIAEAPLLSRLP